MTSTSSRSVDAPYTSRANCQGLTRAVLAAAVRHHGRTALQQAAAAESER
jgi:hypothetical protein